MTLEKKYQAYLDELAAKQEEYPSYGDIDWYAHTGQPDKVKEIIKYGRPIPTLEQFKKSLEEEESDSEFLTRMMEICYNNYRKKYI